MSNDRTIGLLQHALTHAQGTSSDFDLNPDIVLPEGRKLRAAAVLIAIVHIQGEAHVVLTKRASGMKHHPGQIAFPGGKVDDSDDGIVAAALREADEEIGLPPAQVEVLGTLPTHETVTGFVVTPVIGIVRGAFTLTAEPGEVSEIFMVPLTHVTSTENFQVQSRIWQGRKRLYDTVPIGPYYIWGATARMLRNLAEAVQ